MNIPVWLVIVLVLIAVVGIGGRILYHFSPKFRAACDELENELEIALIIQEAEDNGH